MKIIATGILLSSRLISSSAFAANRSSFSSSLLRLTTTKHFSTTSTTLNMSKRVLVPIADDSEEIETSCIQDTLVRFGCEVVVASVKPGGELVCKMSRGLKVMADVSIDEAVGQEWDLVALPGGMPGAEHLRDCAPLISLLEQQKQKGKLYGAMCASPAVVLATKGLVGDGATCYPAPGLREKMSSPVDEDVVVQGNVVTSRGPGTALKFALKMGELMYGAEKAKKIADEMLVA
jgi:4-methyl-5(b-hydroxyethyl)-thiazole monophosphate biosynthesis